MVCQMQPASLLVIESPTSAANIATTWVWGYPGNFPTVSNPSSYLLLLLSISPGKGGALAEGTPSGGLLLQPTPWCYFHPCLLKWSSNQSEVKAGFFEVACGLFILLVMASLFWTGALIGERQKSRVKLHIFWRGRTDNLKRP